MRKNIVAGNWKMNTSVEEGVNLVEEIKKEISNLPENLEVIVCPPFTHISSVKSVGGEVLKTGAQNCHTEGKGAYTGEISASMLAQMGVTHCLVGHSERRAYFFEDNAELSLKLTQLLKNNITPIFCCGEQLEDRKTEDHFDVISNQLEVLWKLNDVDFENIVIAYEPVWAIGTGETATAEQAQEIHSFIRGLIEQKKGQQAAENTSILYGGSCKPSNAKELFAKDDVDGGLIGGAALKANDFVGIINSFS